jgi:hypothetical protein
MEFLLGTRRGDHASLPTAGSSLTARRAPRRRTRPHKAHVRASSVSRRKRGQWAELMQRAFGYDLLGCPHCGGKMKLIAVILERAAIRKILTHIGLPDEPPALAPARASPGAQLRFDALQMSARMRRSASRPNRRGNRRCCASVRSDGRVTCAAARERMREPMGQFSRRALRWTPVGLSAQRATTATRTCHGFR